METENDYPYAYNQAGERANAYMVVGDTRTAPVLFTFAALALVLAGLATGVAFWALSYADKARMEARVLQVKVEGFENAMHAHGLNPNPHLKGEGN